MFNESQGSRPGPDSEVPLGSLDPDGVYAKKDGVEEGAPVGQEGPRPFSFLSALSANFSPPLFRRRGPLAFSPGFFDESGVPVRSGADGSLPSHTSSSNKQQCGELASSLQGGEGSSVIPKKEAHGPSSEPSQSVLSSLPASETDPPYEMKEGLPVLDSEGRYLPVHCERMLLLSSVGLSINPIVAFYFNCMYMGYLCLLVFFTSVLHWYKPRRGWRRFLDICVARFVIVSFAMTAAATASRVVAAIYLCCFFMVLILYSLGWHYSQQHKHLQGTICHVCLHLIGTLANCIFFSSTGDQNAGEAWADF